MIAVKKFLPVLLLILLSIICYSQPTNVSGLISTNTNWTVSGSPYILTGDVTVNIGVTLTIDPGVEVSFSNGDDLFVDGTLTALGTASDSIRFIGETTNDGGIDLRNGSNATFDYAVFDEMGDDIGGRLHALYKRGTGTLSVDHSRFVNNRNGIQVLSGGTVIVDNTTIETSNEFGVRVESGTLTLTNSLVRGNLDKGVYLLDVATIQNTTFSNNGVSFEDCALHIEAAIVPVLDNNTFTNNFIDVITHPEIVDDEIFDTNGLTEIYLDNQAITVNTSWQEPVLPEDWIYRVIGDITVNAGVTLTIDPGVEVSFSNGDDLFVDGTLTALGTASDSIRFIGETTNDGGIDLRDGGNATFDYAVFDEMGDDIGGRLHALYKRGTGTLSVDHSRFVNNRNGIQVLSGGTVIVDNTTIETSNEFGVRVESGTLTLTNSLVRGNLDKGVYLLDVATIQNTTFSNNGVSFEDCALHIEAAIVPVLDNNTFTNNFIDVITHPEIVDDEIFDTNGLTEIYLDNQAITVNTSWQEPVLPEDWIYRVIGDITVNAGVTLTIDPGVEVSFSNGDDLFVDGTLTALGTASDSIRFIGETTNDGGIDLRDGSNATFDYAVFDEMGDDIGGRLHALYKRGTGTLSVDHSRFVNNRNGIQVLSGGTVIVDNTTIETSNEYGVRVENGTLTLTNSLVRGNLDKGVYLLDVATIQNTTFSNNGVSFEDCALHIEAAIVPVLDNNTFTNNFIDVITHPEIVDDEIFDTNGLTEIYLDNQAITVNTSWQEPVLPEDWIYRVIGDITVNAGVTLTIEPGVWVYFGNNDDILVDGTLNAIATPSDSIRFIGETTNDGGIDLRDGSNATFDYAVFDEMGDDIGGRLHALYKRGTGTLSVDHSRFVNNRNGIQVLSGGTVIVDNTTIETSNEFGVRVESGTLTLTNSLVRGNLDKGVYLLDVATIQNTTFSNNGVSFEDCALHIEAAIVPVLDNNTFTNNFIDVITHPEIVDDEIFDTNGLTEIYLDNQAITVNTSWQEPVLPEDWIYRVIGDITVNAGVTLTIEPGVWVYFGNNDDLFVEGTLIADGTVSSTIQFIGETTNDGGIDMMAGSNGSFQYVVFDEMGDDIGGRLTALYIKSSAVTVGNCLFDNCRRGIFIDNGAVPDISAAVFRTSNEYGIYIENGSPVITDSRFEQSGITGIQVVSGSPIISESCIFGNVSYGINNVGSGTVDARNNWWGDVTGPRNDSLNTAGLGDVMSANVLFDPWNTVPCDLIIGPPVIVIEAQPEDTQICEGEDAGFQLTANGDTGLTYQWQEDQGTGFTDLANTGIYNGVTTSNLQIFNVPSVNNGFVYRCIVSGDLAEDEISDEVFLYVSGLPAPPVPSFTDSTICGQTSIQITATGAVEGSYRWYESSTSTVPLSEEGVGSFTTGLIDKDTTFYLSIIDFCETIRIPINIFYATPSITSQPVDVIASIGNDVVFSVEVTGSNLSYQWQKDGADLAFETLPTLSIEDIAMIDEGDYLCVITNSCGQIFSEAATLTIGEPPKPEFILSAIEGVQQVEISGSVDLGVTGILEDLSREFVVENTGSVAISVLDISSSNSKFTVENIPTIIDTQSFGSFNVIFNSSMAGRDSTDLTLEFQDSTFTLRVFAEAIQEPVAPEFILSIIEDVQQVEVAGSVDLGEIEVLTDLSREFVIENTGSTGIIVLGISSSNPKFSVESIPSSIDTQASESFNVVFNSDEVGRDSTNLRIEFQDSVFTLWVFAEAIEDIDVNPEVIIYNAVAPNGDGKHDFFKIENIEFYPENIVEIFNRWGDKVFEVTGYNNDDSNRRFEGARNIGSDGDLVEGTYFYILDLKDGSKSRTGFLLLKR